jgi:hypothetical protein
MISPFASIKASRSPNSVLFPSLYPKSQKICVFPAALLPAKPSNRFHSRIFALKMPTTMIQLGVGTFDEGEPEISEHPRDTSGCTFKFLASKIFDVALWGSG